MSRRNNTVGRLVRGRGIGRGKGGVRARLQEPCAAVAGRTCTWPICRLVSVITPKHPTYVRLCWPEARTTIAVRPRTAVTGRRGCMFKDQRNRERGRLRFSSGSVVATVENCSKISKVATPNLFPFGNFVYIFFFDFL